MGVALEYRGLKNAVFCWLVFASGCVLFCKQSKADHTAKRCVYAAFVQRKNILRIEPETSTRTFSNGATRTSWLKSRSCKQDVSPEKKHSQQKRPIELPTGYRWLSRTTLLFKTFTRLWTNITLSYTHLHVAKRCSAVRFWLLTEEEYFY